MRIPNNILMFAGQDNLAVYEMFGDYWNHYRSMNGKEGLEYQTHDGEGNSISFSEKEELMNAALRREIVRKAGIVGFDEFPLEQWSTHPTLTWATFAVVSALIDMIIPDTIIDTIGMYTEVRTIGWGDSAAFDIKPRDLFVVGKAGRAQRSSEVHKQFDGQMTVVPEMRQITVQVSMYKVLSGLESLAEFVTKMVRSLETQITVDTYNVFNTAMEALPSTATTGLQVSGYTQASLVRLAQQVTAWNGGAKAIVCGTQLALVNVLPDDANYRYFLESDFAKIGYVRTAFGLDVLALPQVADRTTPFGTVLDNSNLYILSPSSQKLVKLVFEGSTLSNTTGTFANANLTQNATIWKSYGAAIATNAVAGIITL